MVLRVVWGDPLEETWSPVELDRIRSSIETRLFQAEVEATNLGRFEIVAPLGRGGMGIVYEARDPNLGRSVAVKVLRAEHHGRGAVRRVLREARALAQLRHPNVVQVFDAGMARGELFIAMEYLEGPTLREWLVRSRDEETVLTLMLALGEGLAAAHRIGVVHRDFKPENVVFGADGRARIVDFGLAYAPHRSTLDMRLEDTLDEPLGDEHHGSGTPAYMAPEQLNNERIDARADQFAFCLVVYEVLTGQRLCDGRSARERGGSSWQEQLERMVPHPRARRVWGVLKRGLSLRRDERYPTMEALLRALVRAQGGRWRGFALPIAAAVLVIGAVVYAATVERSDSALCGLLERSSPQAHSVGLDTWNDGFHAAVNDVCRGRYPRLSGQELPCLLTLKRERDAVVETLAEPWGLGRAQTQAALWLPDPRSCLTVEREPIPLRVPVARLRALWQSGAVETILAEAPQILAEARRLNLHEFEAEVARLLGDVYRLRGHMAEARTFYEAAYVVAADYDRHDAAVEAAFRLATMPSPDGGHWLKIAWSDLHQNPGPHLSQTAYRLELGRVYGLMMDDPHRANRHLSRLERSPATLVAATELLRGDIQLGIGNLPAARAAFQAGLDRRRDELGPRHPMLTWVHERLATVAIQERDWERATAELQAARMIQREAFAESRREVVLGLREAEVQMLAKRWSEARKTLLNEASKERGLEGARRVRLASVELRMNHVAEALVHLDLARQQLREAEVGRDEQRNAATRALLKILHQAAALDIGDARRTVLLTEADQRFAACGEADLGLLE